jgi:hypothetical protein
VREEEGQAGIQYGRVMLPTGMTPDLARTLERIISDGMEDDESGLLPFDIGVRCFEVIRETLDQSPQL